MSTMTTGSVENEKQDIRLGKNQILVKKLYIANATTTVNVAENDLLVLTANGYILWNGTDAGELIIARFAYEFTSVGAGESFPLQAIVVGDVDRSMIKIGGTIATLTEAQVAQLQDVAITAIDVRNETFAGDLSPSES